MGALAFAFIVGLATMFMSASVAKLNNLDEHIIIIRHYNIISKRFIAIFAYVEIFLELFVTLTLFVGVLEKIGLLVMVALLFMYNIAITINLIRGNKGFNCGCGGMAGNHTLSWKIVIRNKILLGVGIWLYQAPYHWGIVSAFIYQEASILEVVQVMLMVWGILIGISLLKNITVLKNRTKEMLSGNAGGMQSE